MTNSFYPVALLGNGVFPVLLMKTENNTEPLRVHSIIQQILDRDVHCASSVLTAVRHVISRLNGERKAFLQLDRTQKRFFIAGCILGHARNKSIFQDVISGHFTEEIENRYTFNKETKQVSINRPQ